MARPRNEPERMNAGQALYIVDRLVRDRAISAAELNRYLGEMTEEIRDLEERIAKLRSLAGSPAPQSGKRRRGRPPGRLRQDSAETAATAAEPASGTDGRRKKRRRRTAATPAQMAGRKLQGSYLGFIRQIPAAKRGRYQKIAKTEGREAAIVALKAALNK